ncbi:Arm DNA-binding domain-containing protein [Methylomonas koyamae]|uniref:Arm DNA-binding domain-containing protein n=1 Tax=Methylomonas koyamae TaxID=702114 RepID=UPI000B11FDFA|nr:Arm DNA-binding domain-containing protein [Methylomonas koyamae]
MATTKLSGSKIDKAQPESGKAQTFIWDTSAPGLALRITQAGGKAYIFESRFNGKTLRMTIGDVKTWSLADAQAEARRLQTLIDAGTDPRQAKAEKIAKLRPPRNWLKLRLCGTVFWFNRYGTSTWRRSHLAGVIITLSTMQKYLHPADNPKNVVVASPCKAFSTRFCKCA